MPNKVKQLCFFICIFFSISLFANEDLACLLKNSKTQPLVKTSGRYIYIYKGSNKYKFHFNEIEEDFSDDQKLIIGHNKDGSQIRVVISDHNKYLYFNFFDLEGTSPRLICPRKPSMGGNN